MTQPRKIVIVGGVAGGATAAARLRRLSESAEIVMLERGEHVSFANCGLPYHIGGEIADRARLLLHTPESLHRRYRLDVRTRHEVVSIDRKRKLVSVRRLANGATYEERYDKLLLATGAAPVRPPLPGIDHPRVLTLRSVPDMDRIKAAADGAHSALVIGGGFIGLEVAENLRRRGLAVHLVEALDQVMPPLDREMASVIHEALARHDVALSLGDSVAGFSDVQGRVAVALKSGASLTGDFAVLAIGVRPESQLAQAAGLELGERGAVRVDAHLRTSDPDIYAVGDSVVTRDVVTGADTVLALAGPANRQARVASDHIFGRGSRYRGSQGTSVVRVFDLVVAMTGASEKMLRRLGRKCEKVYLHPAQHASYFPGAVQMSIKLIFDPADGRILGAQITGGEGVDKRIDVLATAIQSDMTVFDLEELELAYAPQFGSVKDPLNMAGFVAANVVRGDARIVHADALAADSGGVLLDVRTAQEHAAGAIPGARLIPVDELRQRHTELPCDARIDVYCAVGMRGYTAARILTQLGYDARNVSGGYRTWRAFHPATTGTAAPAAAASCGAPAPTSGRRMPEAIAHRKPDDPASRASNAPAAPAGEAAVLDVRGLQCPGPIAEMSRALEPLSVDSVLRVLASDRGFAADVPAWCRQTGHRLLDIRPENGHFVAIIQKCLTAAPAAQTAPPAFGEDGAAAAQTRDKTLVVFSSDLDRVMAALVIANGAAAMGGAVTLFFTFWGLNALRKPGHQAAGKSLMDRAFGWMMPRGPAALSLSRMNMAGVGTALMRRTMRSKRIASLPEMMESARRSGVRFVACSMSMDVMGIRAEELIDGVEIGGVAAYLDSASSSNVNLFI